MDERHTFTECLYFLYLKQRRAFLDITGKKSKMLYETGPQLEAKYMEIFGEEEKAVIEAELNAQLAKELYEKIRALLNRREKVDTEALKTEFSKRREEKLREINSASGANAGPDELSDVDSARMESIYKFMTDVLHPALNPEQTEEEKELYDRVVNAYKNRDLNSLQELRDVYFKGDDMPEYIKNTLLENSVLTAGDMAAADDIESETREIHRRRKTGTDFSLAGEIYDAFELNLKDYEYIDLINELNGYIDGEKSEIEQLKSLFPFTAEEMLKSEKKTAEYSDELKVRMKAANDDYSYYMNKTNQAIGGTANA